MPVSETPVPQVPKRSPVAVTADIRSAALWLLIGGGLCLYFGLSLSTETYLSISEEDAVRWRAINGAINWCLRGVGVLFLIAAAAALSGKRASMLLATIVEGFLALLLAAMAVSWTLEARAAGGWNYQIILLLILAVLGAGGVKRSWELYRAAGGPVAAGRET